MYTNSLADESSLYLQQHAHNPVQWMPWGEASRARAIAEKKLMLVSIGYSACHWCHVMERECFEDEEVAEVMNTHFINVKVDREERPDVDQVYLEAVQMMSRQGGWPLNCFTTPDGLPIYGGTYFPKGQWVQILKQLAGLWHSDPDKIRAYGEQLVEGMGLTESLPAVSENHHFTYAPLDDCIHNWKKRFDPEYGGPNKAPKFPLPSNYTFLLHYGILKDDHEVLQHVRLTLNRMAHGGIYDQVGGGFARYSTDVYWKVPHFEKMLYDNAQLIGLYAEAYHAFGNPEYLQVVNGIFNWLQRDMKHPSGGYFSAIDADSEGEEGKFYTWDHASIIKDTEVGQAFRKFYHSDHNAIWEERLIPVRKGSIASIATQNKVDEAGVLAEFNALNTRLIKERNKQVAPQLDTKCLCSWNAMLASGLALSYQHTQNSAFLKEASGILTFIETELTDARTGELLHSWKDGKAKIAGFLEDYAFTIQAQIQLYRATFDEGYLLKAKAMTETVIDQFYDSDKGLFYFTSSRQNDLISKPVEISDNVIPATNSVMAQNLHTLSIYFDDSRLREIAERMLYNVVDAMIAYGSGYSNWADLYLKKAAGSVEVVITGPKSKERAAQLEREYLPLITAAVARDASQLPLLHQRFIDHKTLIYLCRNQSCDAPIESTETIIETLKKSHAQH